MPYIDDKTYTDDNDKHKMNLDGLKDFYRNKNINHVYKHDELKKTPFEKLDEETKVHFDVTRLQPNQRRAY